MSTLKCDLNIAPVKYKPALQDLCISVIFSRGESNLYLVFTLY